MVPSLLAFLSTLQFLSQEKSFFCDSKRQYPTVNSIRAFILLRLAIDQNTATTLVEVGCNSWVSIADAITKLNKKKERLFILLAFMCCNE